MQLIIFCALQTVLLVTALSLDAFFVSLGYGVGGIRVTRQAALVVALCCSGVLAAGMLLGNLLGPLVSGAVTKWICVPLLALLGCVKIGNSALKALIRRHSRQGQVTFHLFDFRCILNIYADPEKADADHSRVLSAGEALSLGVALSLDGAAAGIGAGLAGIPWLAAFAASMAMTVVFVLGGAALGRRLRRRRQGDLEWISGLLLLLLAVLKLAG